jgi:CheY-like chemotaxis protein
VEALLRRLIGEDVTLATALETGLDHVRADPGQLEQVIVNLAVNARDAMPDGGTLTIETSPVEVGADEAAAFPGMLPGRYVRLALTDTGVGMDRATLARVFEPFFTTKGPGKGTGLGLATVHGIVAQSGGSVTVSSAPGKGTVFTIHLPSVAEKLEPLGTGGQHCSSHGHETILLAEDEAVVRDLAERALVERGYTVLATSSGDEALLACEGHAGAIHLLVTDVVMPGMGGKALAERLLPLRPGLPVLYVSGYADGRVVEEDTLFLQKPFAPSALAERVREALDAA